MRSTAALALCALLMAGLSVAGSSVTGVSMIASPAAAQEFMRLIPDSVEPEPQGPVRTDNNAIRVNFAASPAELRQRLSVPLSEACARLAFNQIRHDEYFVLITPNGGSPTRYGYANGRGLNLKDPEGLSGPDQVYLFFRDGTSQCEVYAFAQP